MSFSSDLPIDAPSEDKYGLDPFAKALAARIAEAKAPNGLVIGLNGPWGSGKSSAINLIRHYLDEEVRSNSIAIVPFNPWWFPGGDTLTLSFFKQLNAAIGPSLPDKLRNSFEAIGKSVSSIGAILGTGANLVLPGSGKIVEAGTGLFGRLTKREKTVESEHEKIAQALRAQPKRFLVVIDDIDRLNPDDVLTIFRLVKSVGRLPNVTYLLSFDRATAERIVAERFPSEGASYLEKIVQTTFDIPPPMPDGLREQTLRVAVGVMGEPLERQITRWWNVFMDVVAPVLRSPRDVVRIENQLAATWPSVAGNVDRADFLAITALQIGEPEIYNAIRTHPTELTGAMDHNGRREQGLPERYDTIFGLAAREERETKRLRVGLRRLFPKLDAVWGNSYHNGDSWRRDRLIASEPHFRSYFAHSISPDILPADRIEALVARADDAAFIENELRSALATIRRNGTTQASLLLEELMVYADDVDAAKVHHLVATLFTLADDLDVDADRRRGFSGIGDNQLRLHWLLNRLVHERFDQGRREVIYREAMQHASLDWACDFAERCVRYFQPRREGERDHGEPIVSEQVAQGFVRIALGKLRAAAESGELMRHLQLNALLFAWLRLNGGDSGEVLEWTTRAMADPAFVLCMAKSMPSEAWSQGMGFGEMGDRAARRRVYVNPDVYQGLIDVPALDRRVGDLLQSPDLLDEDKDVLQIYLNLPREDPGSSRRRGEADTARETDDPIEE